MEGKKDQCRHKWNRDGKDNGKDQWNEALFFSFWKDKQNRPLDKLAKRKRERTQNQKCMKRWVQLIPQKYKGS